MRLRQNLQWALALALGVSACGCASNRPPDPYGQASAPPGTWSKFTAAVAKPFKSDPNAGPSQAAQDQDPTSVFAKPKQLDANFYVSVARMQERGRNEPAAAASYQKALSLEPKNVPALLDYARMLDRQKSFPDAIALYERAVALEPKNAAACNDLGLCLARQGQLDKAVARLQQAVKLQPAKTLYRNNLATVLVEIGDPQNAYAHLAAVHPADVAHYNVGYLLAQSNQPNGAAQHFDAALKANPNLVEARQWLDSLGRTESIAAATPAPAKPQAAVPAERVSQQYDDRPRHTLPTPQPTVKQPRPLQVGERYGVSEEFSRPTAPRNERAAPQSSAVDYEALPEAATVYPATGGAGQAPTHHSEATGLRPYEARNSGWSDAPPARW